MSATVSISTLHRFAVAAIVAASLAQPAAAIEPVVAAGEAIEARVDGDLNGDGSPDLAYVVGTDAWRQLRVALSGRSPVEALDLDLDPLGPGTLSIEGNVLKLGDLTGGTTAIGSTRRFRYDARHKQMRLIGLDATFYSRTYAHDGFEMSWNLLTGDTITRELRLNRGAGNAAYDKVGERTFKRRIRPQFLSDAPDPETTLEESRQD